MNHSQNASEALHRTLNRALPASASGKISTIAFHLRKLFVSCRYRQLQYDVKEAKRTHLSTFYVSLTRAILRLGVLRDKHRPKSVDELRKICYELDLSDIETRKITRSAETYRAWVNLHVQSVESDSRYFDYLGLLDKNQNRHARKQHMFEMEMAKADKSINSTISNISVQSSNIETVSLN